ncbi:Uncharacterized protein Adt_13461 [Abeliophyllum distichum]|uniref:Uncharacterized protein n=1 Tax=Abeliophyllum distichum TaxID=126358 RepID=A0ABD1TWV5_9LAMI
MHSPAFKCVREWDAFAFAPDVPKDSEGLWPGSDSGCPKWMESNGGGHVFVVSALLRHRNAFACVSNHLPAEEVAEEEGQGGGSGVRVFDDLKPDLDVPSVYGIASASSANAFSFNKAEAKGSGTWIYRRYLVEEGHRRPESGGKQGGGPSQPKKKVVELVDNYAVCASQPLQRTLSVYPSGEVVLDSPPLVDPVSGGSGVGPFDSRKRLRELIGPPGSRISDYALKNMPFFPSMGAQAIKKYFTPKWEEFASHGDLEDVLEAGLAAAIIAMSLQMKVLETFRARMEKHKKLVTKASKFDKEH